MDIKSRNTEKKSKQQICRLNDFLSFQYLQNKYKLIKSFIQLKYLDSTT